MNLNRTQQGLLLKALLNRRPQVPALREGLLESRAVALAVCWKNAASGPSSRHRGAPAAGILEHFEHRWGLDNAEIGPRRSFPDTLPGLARLLPLCMLVGVGSGCTDVSRFDTGPRDAYCGTVVGAPFVRQGFDRSTQAELRIATSALNTIPGVLTTHRGDNTCGGEALFGDAPLRAPTKLESDPLSLLEFGQGRELNFMAWVDSTCDGTYLAVVSLMHDDTVELRLMRGQVDDSGEEVGPLGVFPLSRGDRGCGNE